MTRLGFVDPTSLLGEAVRERLAAIGLAEEGVVLVSSDEEVIGTLVDFGTGASLVARFDPQQPPAVDLLLVCSPRIEAGREIVAHRPEDTEALVLCFDAGEEYGPLVFADHPRPPTAVTRAAPPSALLLLEALAPLAPLGNLRASATVSLPASVRGDEEALHRLMGQARSLLGFQEVELGDLPRQLVFNQLPAAGLGAVIGDREIATAVSVALGDTLAGAAGPPPEVAVQQLAASLFHAITASVHVAFEQDPGLAAVTAALASSPTLVAAPELPLGALDAAGEPAVLYAPPSASGHGYWLWLVADNVLLTAANAARLVEERVRPAS